jgi:glycosyltransferase involved in cell wall biosynthesis
MEHHDLRLSVVVPFHRNLLQLGECLRGLAPLPEWADVIIVADGAIDRCHELAADLGAHVIEVAGPRGPAVARNRGATEATGDIIVFIDADVVAAPGTLVQIRDRLQQRPEIAAVFGAYDERPRDTGFISQYRNLSHAYFHQASRPEARTFWAGLGAIRREALEAVGGFDERFGRPCVEDIELGYRLTALGYRILLDPTIRGCHLKRWTLRSAIVSDVRDRGIPWTQLMFKFTRADNDLNLQITQRIAVVLACLLMPLLALAIVSPVWFAAAGGVLIVLAALNWRYYAFFVRRRGLWFGCRVFPMHVLHHLCNGLSFVLGCTIFYATSRVGVAVPGSVPLSRWDPKACGLPE